MQVEILTQRSVFLEAELEKKSRQLQEKTEQARTETEKNNAAKEVIKTLMMQVHICCPIYFITSLVMFCSQLKMFILSIKVY